MKQGIHPNWHNDTAVTCSCGNQFQIGSLTDTLIVDICNKCHPFFTGEMRFVDRQGRVDKFMKKVANAQTTAAGKKNKKSKKQDDAKDEGPRKSYQDILRQQQTNLKQSAAADTVPTKTAAPAETAAKAANK